MNWNKLFGKSEILTAGDRARLEKLEEDTKELRDVADRIVKEWPDHNNDRDDRLRGLAEGLAAAPSEDKYQALIRMASFPDRIQQLKGRALEVIGGEIERRMQPQHAITREVLTRALKATETELQKTESKERKTAAEEGFSFSPSGKILALQQRILELRNGIAAKVPGEDGCLQSPGGWRHRLAEWI